MNDRSLSRSVVVAARPIALLLAMLASPPALVSASEPENRGRLSLAWDAHESGLCEELLGYVDAISPDSPLLAEGLWLKTDCLRSLGRFAEALSLLESPAGKGARDRSGLIRGVVEDWVWEKTHREEYGEAMSILDRGLRSLPAEPSLLILAGATSFRSHVRSGVGAAGTRGLPGGEEILVRKGNLAPEGSEWIRAYPWMGDTLSVPEATPEDWMPLSVRRLERAAKVLWVRIPRSALDRALTAEARKQGLSARADRDGFRLLLRGEEVFWDRKEWQMRAAVEGLGIRGAVAESVTSALSLLKARESLSAWVGRSHGLLGVAKMGPLLRLTHPVTGRTHDLDLDSWVSSYDLESKDWRGFWDDLTAELGREPGAYRCFCGRDAVLREVLTQDPAGATVFEKGKGYVVVLTSLCPLHQQPVTAGLLKQWSVSPAQAWDRAKKDAMERPWDLSFERGEEGGTPYLALQGEGASSLARRPELLLGALEAVEGSETRGALVQVLAPTPSSLVVVGDRVPEGKARAAATRALLRGARRGEAADRLGYRATLRLPSKARGRFEVRSAEGP